MPRPTTAATAAGRAQTDLARRIWRQHLATRAAHDPRKLAWSTLVVRAGLHLGLLTEDDLVPFDEEVTGDAT